jgi:hypothetical protein
MNATEQNAIDLLGRANPIQPDTLELDASRSRHVLDAAMRSTPTKTRRLGHRSLRVALPAAAVGALALVGVLLLSALSGSEENALAIERTDRYIRLEIEDPSASAERMNRELRENGIDIEVELVPVLPAVVGHWVGGRAVWPGVPEGADQHELGDKRIRELNEAARGRQLVRDPDDPTTMLVPREFRGHFLLYAGRAARPGEKPWIDGNPPGAR